MCDPARMAEVMRGPILESVHDGHAVIARADGSVVESWGDPALVMLPRSSCKMIQALPLVESGAGAHLSTEQLALACASHSGERMHVERVSAWLTDLGLDEHALCCGPQTSRDEALAAEMIRRGEPVTRLFSNCSGKHAGFLTLTRHLGAGPDYVNPEHPVQKAVRAAFEHMTGEASPGYGIDGCSAPNFAASLSGLATAMARFASAEDGEDARQRAAVALRNAMMKHPELVAGTGRVCTAIMRAATEPLAVKTGAEGVFVAILPKQKLGVALKIADGATRASEAAITALLVRLGALDPKHPDIAALMKKPVLNWDGLVTGAVTPSPALLM